MMPAVYDHVSGKWAATSDFHGIGEEPFDSGFVFSSREDAEAAEACLCERIEQVATQYAASLDGERDEACQSQAMDLLEDYAKRLEALENAETSAEAAVARLVERLGVVRDLRGRLQRMSEGEL